MPNKFDIIYLTSNEQKGDKTVMADNDTTIGRDAWTGKPVNAPKKNTDIPLTSDMPPLSGKSVTSVPEEHRYDRVPKPMKNTNPNPEIPVDGYYKRYNELMDRAQGKEPNQPQRAPEPSSGAVAEDFKASVYVETDKAGVLQQVRAGIPAALYDGTIIPLLEKGMAVLAFAPAKDGIIRIVAMSTKDGKPLREVGYARGPESH
jgi:hypothetical protein